MQFMQPVPLKRAARVLRFEFSDALIEHLEAFVNLHQCDDRKTYKEAWTVWLAHDEIAALLHAEIRRLSDIGYKGDVADKLFKSGRYYYRTREPTVQRSSLWPRTPNDANRGRKYVLLNRDLLNAMDAHIERGLRRDDDDHDTDGYPDGYTPANGFADFWNAGNNHAEVDTLRKEVVRLSEIMPTGEAVHNKLKKTYKNRYFMIINAIQ